MTSWMAKRRRCYVASPLGFTEAGASYYRDHFLPGLASVVDVVDPWDGAVDEEQIAEARASGRLYEYWIHVGYRNLSLIDNCNLMVAVLDGQEPDSGSVVEVGYAVGRGIRCYGLRTDLRQAGEEGMRLNLQVEATIVKSGGQILQSLNELTTELARVRR
jgi:nucleoside 2-deoxyribosyltransferase